jgi:hypothetical protein
MGSQQSNLDGNYSPLRACHVLIDLVPRLAWLGSPVERRHQVLSQIRSYFNISAAIVCSAGNPKLPLEWLEQGRSIVRGQVLNFRSPLDELEAQHPQLSADI